MIRLFIGFLLLVSPLIFAVGLCAYVKGWFFALTAFCAAMILVSLPMLGIKILEKYNG